MSTRLTLIAHAPTAATRTAAFPRDEGVDERGLAQVKAASLPAAQRVWTSPARCAVDTARALGLEAIPEVSIADADYGRWAGRAFAEVAGAEPAALAAWMSDPTAAPHGGESVEALLARVGTWMEARRGERGHGIAVTHSAVIRAAVVHALGAPPLSFWRIDIEPLSCTELRPNAGRWALRALGLTIARAEVGTPGHT